MGIQSVVTINVIIKNDNHGNYKIGWGTKIIFFAFMTCVCVPVRQNVNTMRSMDTSLNQNYLF